MDLDTVKWRGSHELVRDHLQPSLDSIGDKPSMRARNLDQRISLPHHEHVFDLSQKVPYRVAVCAAHKQEVRACGFVPEEGSANQVVVQRGLCLTRVNAAELHEGRLVRQIENERLAEIGLGTSASEEFVSVVCTSGGSWAGLHSPLARVHLAHYACDSS